MSIRTPFPWFLLAGLLAALAFASSRDDGVAAGETRTGRVVRVVDGDTLKVRLDGGRRETVRLIGVDTPESVKPGSPVECFGPAASAYTKRLVQGRRVRLVADVEARDRYGRMLAYVHRRDGDLFVNAALVRDGYAQPLTIPPNVRHADAFRRLARQAREARRGLWKSCPKQ